MHLTTVVLHQQLLFLDVRQREHRARNNKQRARTEHKEHIILLSLSMQFPCML